MKMSPSVVARRLLVALDPSMLNGQLAALWAWDSSASAAQIAVNTVMPRWRRFILALCTYWSSERSEMCSAINY